MSKKDKMVFAVIGLAQIALIGLRLGRVIGWHWVWVLGPTLFCAGLFVAVIMIAMTIEAVKGW